MATRDEVHVGDVGTKYRSRCLDRGSDFDPSSATVKEITFQMPGLLSAGVSIKTLTRDAQSEAGTGDEAGRFYLYYIVTQTDVDDSGFHSKPGKVKIQGYVEFVDGTHYHSDIVTEDDAGTEFRVYKNL